NKKFIFGLSFSELIKRMLCRRLLNKKQLLRVRIYDEVEKYIKERLDVYGYLDLVSEFNKVKSIIFNNHQNTCLDYIEKPTVNINPKFINLDNVDNLKFILPSKFNIIKENEV